MFSDIKCGSTVTIRNAAGQEHSGRAIMFNRKIGGWVLNMGGRYGMPGIATERNVVAVKAPKQDGFTAQARILNGWRGV